MADNRKRQRPACPNCGSADISHVADLRTRPAVHSCNVCCELFTSKYSARGTTNRKLRRTLIQRWDQLADDLRRLEMEIRAAPEGVFTDEERAEVVYELGQTVWDVMVNHRPQLPASVYEPIRARETVERRRDATRYLIASLSDEHFARLYPDMTREEVLALVGGGS